nr:reverse transcriptase domain-containing protein [Tanacetum cinerariifolium]
NSNATIPRRQNKSRVPNIVEPEIRTIEEVVPMADRSMKELLQAPTEGYGEAIVVSKILAENFEIKTNLLQLVQTNKFHGFERDNPHTHISNFKRMTSTLKYRDVHNDAIKLMLFPYSLEGAAIICNPSSNPTPSTNLNPKGCNRRRSKQRIEDFNLEELSPPIVTMVDQRTMAQFLQAPTEGYEDAIVVPTIIADNFELKHGLLTLVQNKQFFGHDKEDPHAHVRYFNKITSTLKFPNVSNTSIKLMLFPFFPRGCNPDLAGERTSSVDFYLG